jgi:hypothetical protein
MRKYIHVYKNKFKKTFYLKHASNFKMHWNKYEYMIKSTKYIFIDYIIRINN